MSRKINGTEKNANQQALYHFTVNAHGVNQFSNVQSKLKRWSNQKF
jgi:hypothetical protein